MTTKQQIIEREKLSEYLLEGFKRMDFDLYQISFEPRSIVTRAHFTDMYISPPEYYNPLGSSHLGLDVALRIVSQSLIAWYCNKARKPKKELGEFIGKSLQLEAKRPLDPRQDIICRIDIGAEKLSKYGLFCKLNFGLDGISSLDNKFYTDSFKGSGELIFPLSE